MYIIHVHTQSISDNISKMKEELEYLCSHPDDKELIRTTLYKCIKTCDDVKMKVQRDYNESRKREYNYLISC